MRFIPQLPAQFSDKNNKKSAKAAFMNKIKNGGKGTNDMTQEERHQALVQEKMNEIRAEAMKGAKYTFNLPGTDPTQCKELSKGAQEIIQKIAEKKAKQEEKKRKKADIIAVTAKSFTGAQGGRIDRNGNIYDSAGQCILTVDKKTGKIKNQAGSTVGNYNPDSTYSEHRVTELIAKYSTTNSRGWYAGTLGVNGNIGNGVWGKDTDSCGNGSIWGSGSSGGGSVWGSKSDDNNSGWW